MGMFMMGSIWANFVRASTPLTLTIGNDVYKIQDYFDMIAPGILPLTAVVLSYLYLERKGNKYMHVLIGLLVYWSRFRFPWNFITRQCILFTILNCHNLKTRRIKNADRYENPA